MADLSKEVEGGPSIDVKQKKETDSEPGESSQDSHNVQEAEVKMQNYKYRFNKSETFSVPCKTSLNVLEALNTSPKFRDEKDKKKNKQKEILIQRFKEGVHKAAVKADFPCCLIKTDEILEIDFIQKDPNSSTNPATEDPSLKKISKPEMFVTFKVKKEGGQNVIHLLKNEALRKKVQHVCVYAFKGEEIQAALERDGRFNSVIFQKHCALRDELNNLNHEFSNLVTEALEGKEFHVVVISDSLNQPDSQDNLTPVKTEPNVASDADVSSQNPVSTEQDKKQDGNTTSTNPLTKQYAAKPMADSKEILGILRAQFAVLLKQLKQREKLKYNSEVQKFFREEYAKSVESFLEVKKVKQLMKLSDSVCQIQQGGSALGTGFLLYDNFILTNAHVIRLSTDVKEVDATQFTAVFGYEDLNSTGRNEIPVKQLTAYSYEKDNKGRHLDYALLELDDISKIAEYPKLRKHYSPDALTNRGQICIVGHPGGGVKKMDPCFIIERENRLEAAEKHKTENEHLIHLMNKACSEQKWNFLAKENEITYDSCFFHGSSGSPVFDVNCKLIAIHTGGYVYNKEEHKVWSFMEYGYSMQPILEHINAKVNGKGDQSNVCDTAEQQHQNDIEMKSV